MIAKIEGGGGTGNKLVNFGHDSPVGTGVGRAEAAPSQNY
jgi:hypothetical protein